MMIGEPSLESKDLSSCVTLDLSCPHTNKAFSGSYRQQNDVTGLLATSAYERLAVGGQRGGGFSLSARSAVQIRNKHGGYGNFIILRNTLTS